MKTIVAVVICCLLFSSAVLGADVNEKLRASINKASGSSSFDYFVFSMTWPGNACRQLSPCHIPSNIKDFTIHGLWPSRNTGPLGPFFCGGNFVYSQVQDLVSDLNQYWTDYKNEIPSFWSHEYEKHGTCAASLPSMNSEYKYFKVAIDLRKSMNILPSFAAAGITPSDGQSYHIQQMKNAMNAAGYGTPAFSCLHGEQHITEMRFCADKNLKFIACPIKDQCSDLVMLDSIHN